MLLYMMLILPLVFIIIGIPLIIALVAVKVVCIIIASVKSAKGEIFTYPLAIPFFQ
jgi:uncharacterized Tic20 family protein